jgi:tRNA nucleotidyltransferase (CCA-adding enzyme)
MERYRPRGSHSSKPVRSQPEAKAELCALATTPALRTLFAALQPAQLFLVGGSVRDSFFGPPKTDLDLATDISVTEVAARCKTHNLRVVETGIQHGTLLVVIDGVHLEVTTFRQPADRNTQINARNIETDLAGRDFTINAIAFCLTASQLIDPFGGIADLSSGLIRCVGDARTRFSEDPLRILRMVRFGSAQGREIEPHTLAAATALIHELERVSVERIRHETEAILMSPCPAAGVQSLHTLGALSWTLPELTPAVGFEQNRYHIHDVFDHTLAVLDRTPPDRILRWAAIFHDVGKPHTLSVDAGGERHFYSHEVVSNALCRKRMEHLKFSHDDIKQVCSVVRHHMRPLNCGPAGVRRLIRDLGDTLPLWRAFKDADSSPTIASEEVANTARAFDSLLAAEQQKMATPSYGRLAINGDDLKLLGMKSGPQMGAVLKQLEETIIEDPSRNSKDSLVTLAKELLAKGTQNRK